MPFADTEAVVSVNDAHILVDNDSRIASVFKDIPLYRRKLLRTQRREQLFHLQQGDRRPLGTAVFGFVFCKVSFPFSLI